MPLLGGLVKTPMLLVEDVCYQISPLGEGGVTHHIRRVRILWKTSRLKLNVNSPLSPRFCIIMNNLKMRETVIDRRKTVAWKQEIGSLEGVDTFNNKGHQRKKARNPATINVPQRPEIYRSQKRKKPRFSARPYE